MNPAMRIDAALLRHSHTSVGADPTGPDRPATAAMEMLAPDCGRCGGGLLAALGLLFGLVTAQGAFAAPVAFTSRPAFDAAVTAVLALEPGIEALVHGFDDQVAGTLIPSEGFQDRGLWFRYDFGAKTMKISDAYPTTSASNFLGTTDTDIFTAGDNFEILFSSATKAVGMYFISADLLINGDIVLDISYGGAVFSASLDALGIEDTLSDGSSVYFLGIVEAEQGFDSALVRTDPNGIGAFFYNVDDVVNTTAIPEPALGALITLMTGVLAWRARRRAIGTSGRSE